MKLGELFHSGDHLGGGYPIENFGLGPGALVAQLLEQDEVADIVEADVVLARALEPVPEQVAHDREEPRLHVGAGLVAVLVAEGAQIRLLDQVLCLIGIPRQSERAAIKRVQVCQCLFRKGSSGRALSHQYSQFRFTCLAQSKRERPRWLFRAGYSMYLRSTRGPSDVSIS